MLELPNSPFRRVVLPLCGLELDIRRVDVKTLGMDAAMTYVSRSGLLGEANAYAQEGAAQARASSKAEPRPESPPRHREVPGRAQIGAELVRLTERAIIRAALEGTAVEYDALLAAFRATDTTPDLGMGRDYHTLVTAIVEHSGFRQGVSALPPEEAERFPARLGANTGRHGPALRPAAE